MADANFAQGKVKVIVDEEEIIEVDIELFYQPANRLPAQVHIGLGSGYHHLTTGYLTHTNSGLPLLFIKSDALRPGKMVQADKAHIMAVISITPPRIA